MKQLYSQVMGNQTSVMTSGQIALDAQGALVGANDITAQTLQALQNAETHLKERGFTKQNIVSLTIFLQDIANDFDGFNAGYTQFFEDCKPSRITVQATLFKPEFLIEVQAIADIHVDNRKN